MSNASPVTITKRNPNPNTDPTNPNRNSKMLETHLFLKNKSQHHCNDAIFRNILYICDYTGHQADFLMSSTICLHWFLTCISYPVPAMLTLHTNIDNNSKIISSKTDFLGVFILALFLLGIYVKLDKN